jgi:putative FmdB family regulatory protein
MTHELGVAERILLAYPWLVSSMKLHDFHCRECGQEFEELVHDVTDARCPSCASANVEKQLSAFAVGSRSGAPMPSGGCAGGFCGGGACKMN